MSIPLVDLRAGFQEVRQEILESIEQVLDGMHLFLGPHTGKLEDEFANFLGARASVAVSNGTDALVLALKAVGIGVGDEVILPSHTFFATAEAVVHVGATVVFADVAPEHYTLDLQDVAAKLTNRTKAVIPVHLYGHPADMDGLTAVLAGRDVVVVEDASQAHGARYRDRSVGTLGRAAAFSCYFTKNLGAYGEAGLVTTQDDEVLARLRLLRNHGHVTKERHEAVGYNNRMDEIQAVILRTRLRRLRRDNARRRAVAQAYRDRLEGVQELGLPTSAAWAEHAYHLFVIRHPRRDALRAFLQARGIATGVHYAVPIHLQPAVASFGYAVGDLPVTEKVCGEILSLPMYPQLTMAQVDEVCEGIRAFPC